MFHWNIDQNTFLLKIENAVQENVGHFIQPSMWISHMASGDVRCHTESNQDNLIDTSYNEQKYTQTHMEKWSFVDEIVVPNQWWRHQMETFSALLAICAGNSPVTGELPAQRPVTRSFDVFFGLRLNKRLSKQSWGWWFETLSRPLWCHSNVDSCYNSPAFFAMEWNTLRSSFSKLSGVSNSMIRPWSKTIILLSIKTYFQSPYIDGLVQERRNSGALAMQIRLSCTNPSIFGLQIWRLLIRGNGIYVDCMSPYIRLDICNPHIIHILMISLVLIALKSSLTCQLYEIWHSIGTWKTYID